MAKDENYRPILVVGRQRSGTTVLRRLIASSNIYKDLSEIFHDDFLRPTLEERADFFFFAFLSRQLATNRRFLHPMYWVQVFDLYLEKLFRDHSRKVILDVKYNMLNFIKNGANRPGNADDFGIIDAAYKNKMLVVHIMRRNVLRTLVSEQIALNTNQWGITNESQRKVQKVMVDPFKIVDRLKSEIQTASFVRDAMAALPDVIEVEYSEMFNSAGMFDDMFVNKLEARLGLTGLVRTPKLFKQNPAPLSELISNYDAVAHALSGTRFGWMLETAG